MPPKQTGATRRGKRPYGLLATVQRRPSGREEPPSLHKCYGVLTQSPGPRSRPSGRHAETPHGERGQAPPSIDVRGLLPANRLTKPPRRTPVEKGQARRRERTAGAETPLGERGRHGGAKGPPVPTPPGERGRHSGRRKDSEEAAREKSVVSRNPPWRKGQAHGGKKERAKTVERMGACWRRRIYWTYCTVCGIYWTYCTAG